MTGSGFDPAAAARSLWRKARQASLATVSADGMPFNSWIGLAADPPTATLVLLLSDLAVHSINLKGNSRASVLIVGGPGDIGDPPCDTGDDPLTLPRLTLVGHAAPASDLDTAGPVYLARHPDAAGYAGFADFRYYRFTPESAHLVAGFGRIASIDPAAFSGPS